MRRHNEDLSKVRSRLLSRKEGQILLTGCGLVMLYLFWLGVQGIQSPQRFRLLIGVTATNVVFGRAAGMSFGYMGDISATMVLLVNIWVETIMVLLFYPLFVFSWEHLIEIKGLKKFMTRIHQAAEANQDLIRKYGIIGLFAFVWLPFWMTGPLVGCVIGFLIQLHPWVNIVIVLSATYLTTIIWAVLLLEVHEWVATYSSYAPFLILGVIILVVSAGHFIGRHRQKNQYENGSRSMSDGDR